MHGEGGGGGRDRERGKVEGPQRGKQCQVLYLRQDEETSGENHEDEATKETRKGERTEL